MGPVDFTPLIYVGVLIGAAAMAVIGLLVWFFVWLFGHVDITWVGG